MESALQRANTDRKVTSRFGRRQALHITQQNDLTVVSVELRNSVGQDAFDLLSGDLVLHETAGICEVRKHVGQIFFTSTLSH